MVLGKTSSAGASYNLYYSRTRASCTCSRCGGGGSGGAMVLGKTSSAGASYNLYYSRTRASCTCSRCEAGGGGGGRGCGGLFGCLDIFTLIYHFSFSPLSPSLWEMAQYRLKYCLKGLLNQKQPTNQRMKKYVVTLH